MDYVKKLTDYIKKLIGKKTKKKLIENSVIIIIIGIIIIIAGGTLFSKGSNSKTQINEQRDNGEEVAARNVIPADRNEIEDRMEQLLCEIDGAGKVSVMITYVSGGEKVPAFDTKKDENDTNEKDNAGGTRSSTQNSSESTVVYEEEQGNKKPVIVKEILPEVKGVVVVADGADDPVVREELCSAVGVLLDVPVHKIQVCRRSGK